MNKLNQSDILKLLYRMYNEEDKTVYVGSAAKFECDIKGEHGLFKGYPPPNRKDIIDYYGDKVIDYSKILYSTRLINLLTHYWVAWSEDDKAEDYHPLFNKDIMKRRMSSYIKLDWEPEDDKESQPYCEFDFEKDNMFYREPIDLTDATFE